MRTDLIADRFQIVARVGEGGVGVVYRAVDRRSGGHVALKVLRDPAGSQDRFAREAALLSRIDDEGLVRYVAHGSCDDGPYLAMEWLEGEDLAARLARGPISIDAALTLGERIATTLIRLHERGVVHRDLKPSNVWLVDGDVARPKVLDLGMAHVRATIALTRTGMPLGTPAYMAPEQARGAKEIDGRVDLYALGSLLYECIAGRAPFEGPHPLAILTKILFDEARPLAELAPHAPEPLLALVAQLIAKSPSDRPSNAASVAQTIAAIPRGTAVPSSNPAPRHVSITPAERAIVAVVMVEARADVDDDVWDATLRDVAGTHGASIERLPDRTAALVWHRERSVGERALRAARAALRLRGGDALRVSLAIGRTESSSQLALGEVIERAVDLLGRSRGEVYIDRIAAEMLESGFVVRAHAERVLVEERGSAAPVRTVLGRPSPWVGRDQEIASLRILFERCVDEPCATLALVTGEAGIGKSRLRHELTSLLADRGALWIGRGDPMRAGAPFALIVDALRSALGVRDGDPADVRRSRLVDEVASSVPPNAQARVVELLAELLAVPLEGAASPLLEAARRDPVLMGDHVRNACLELVAGRCAQRPLILVLEDLHWGDLSTMSVVDHLRRNLRSAPLFVLALARPEARAMFPALFAREGVSELRLGPLRPKASATLARALLGDAVDELTIERIVQHADGHAFFLEELVRAEARHPGAAAPATVLTMLEARLVALPLEQRRVLRAASVFGQSCWKGGIARLVSPDEADVDRALRALIDEELLVPRHGSRLAGEDELGFRHDLVRQTAYEMLTAEDRQLGHRLAGEWLEAAGHRDALSLAEHFERGGAPKRALPHLLRGAEEAIEGNDLRASIAIAERALEHDPDRAMRIALRAVQGTAASWRGDEVLERATCEVLALAAPPDDVWYSMHVALVRGLSAAGRVDRVKELVEQLVSVADRVPPTVELGHALAMEAVNVWPLGLLELCDRLFATYRVRVEGFVEPTHALRSAVAQLHASVAQVRGDIELRLQHLREARAAYLAGDDRRRAIFMTQNIAHMLLELGGYAEAESLLDEALADAERMGIDAAIAIVVANRGLARTRLCRWDAAEQDLARALELVQLQNNVRVEGGVRLSLARLALHRRRFDEARAQAERSVELMERAAPLQVGWSLAVLAFVELARGDVSSALAHAERAFAGTDRMTHDKGEAGVRLAYVEALTACGRSEEARAALVDARRSLLAFADRLSSAAHRTTFLTNIAEHARILELARELG